MGPAGSGDPCDVTDHDEKLLEDWFEVWRHRYVTRGEDATPEQLCGTRGDLVSALRGLIRFEKLNLGGPVPKQLIAESRYEIIGPYEPDHAGGQGDLYLALDPAFPRVVLVKRIKSERATDPDAIRRFRREMLLTGQLEHPNIVPVFDHGVDRGELFYVMRLVPGETYHRRITRFHTEPGPDRFRTLEFRTLLQQFIVICRAVAYAHSAGRCISTSPRPTFELASTEKSICWIGALVVGITIPRRLPSAPRLRSCHLSRQSVRRMIAISAAA